MMLPMGLFTRTVNVTVSVPFKMGSMQYIPYQFFYSCISKVVALRIQTGTCNNVAVKMSKCSMLL